MDDDGCKEPHSPDQSHQPIGLGAKIWEITREKPLRKRPHHQKKDDPPTRIDRYGKTKQFE